MGRMDDVDDDEHDMNTEGVSTGVHVTADYLRKLLVSPAEPSSRDPNLPEVTLGDDLEIAVLVQTCDKYSWFWEDWHFFFSRAWEVGWKVYLMTENKDADLPGVTTLKTGSGKFSNRLTLALKTIPHRYILYLQDDFWPVAKCTKAVFNQLLDKVRQNHIQLLKLLNVPEMGAVESGRVIAHASLGSTRNSGLSVCSQPLLNIDHESPFLLSHQASIWERPLMLACMRDGESAFENEVLGTQRLQKKVAQDATNPEKPPFRAHAIKFDWYRAVMGTPGPAGKMNAYGQVMQNYIRAHKRANESAASLEPSGTTWHEQGSLPTQSCLPDAHQAKLNEIDAAYGRVNELMRAATAKTMGAANTGPSAQCPLCKLTYHGHKQWYSYKHPCPETNREQWFHQQRQDAAQS